MDRNRKSNGLTGWLLKLGALLRFFDTWDLNKQELVC